MKSILSFLLILAHLQLLSQVSFVKSAFNQGTFGSFQDCAVDMNGDQLDDIVAINKGRLQIYYQQNDGSFTNTIFNQEFTNTADWSICAGDIDGNGFNDLAIGGIEAVSFIYANENGSAYTEDAKPDYLFSQRTSFADINNDGHLDAFVCSDDNENHPFRNDGSGNLILDFDLLKSPEEVPGNYSTTWTDYDNDGDLDLHIAKCVQGGGPDHEGRINLLFQNDGAANFTEVAAAAGLQDTDQSWITLFEDFDNDGDFDAITFNHEVRNRIMVNDGNGVFTDVVFDTGIPSGALGAFEALATDFDNDGNMDIITDVPARIYYGNGDMTFRRVDTQVPASALGDFDSDGFIDVLRRNEIYYNQGNANHWLRVNTIGTESNRNGIAARLELYGSWGMQMREVRATQSWSPMSTLATHFGIGNATEIDSLVVRWPSGKVTTLCCPDIDQAIIVDESNCPFDIPNLVVQTAPLLCEGESALLSADPGFVSYEWSTGETSSSIEVSETGLYNLTVTDENSCTSFTNNVQIYSITGDYEIIAPDGTEFCEGRSKTLELNVPFDVEWSNGRTGNINVIFESGIYSATIVSDCPTTSDIEPIMLTEHLLEPLVLQDVFIDTTEQGPYLISLPDGPNTVPNGVFLFWWTEAVGGQPLSGNNFTIQDLPSDLTLYVSYSKLFNGNLECTTERFPLNIRPIGSQNTIVTSADPYLCAGEEIQLIAPSSNSYEWSTGDQTNSITVSEAGLYNVTLTDVDGNQEVLPTVEIFVTAAAPPEVANVTVASGEPSVVIALEGNNLSWWDASEGGALLFEGNELEHFINEDEFTYYIDNRIDNGNNEFCISDRVPLTVFVTSNVTGLSDADKIIIYPNPSKGQFIVQLQEVNLLEQISVRDVSGRVVFTQRRSFTEELSLDLGGLKSGLYLVEFDYTTSRITKKLIITK